MKYLTVSSMVLLGACLACDRAATPMTTTAPVADAPSAPVEFCGRAVEPDATRVECDDRSVVSVEPLAALPDLETVILDHTRVADLKPLVACTKLEELSIRDTRVVDVSILSALPSLRTLAAKGAPIDLATVAALTQLADLELSPGGEHLDALAELDLVYLAIDSETVTDITALSGKVFAILTLELPQLRDVSALASTNVSFLNLDVPQLIDVRPVLEIEGLDRLRLITHAKLEALTQCEFETFEYLSVLVPPSSVSDELRRQLGTCAEVFLFWEWSGSSQPRSRAPMPTSRPVSSPCSCVLPAASVTGTSPWPPCAPKRCSHRARRRGAVEQPVDGSRARQRLYSCV